MNQRGQSLIEFNLVSILILTPLLAGGMGWGVREFKRFECAYKSFTEARSRLILTHAVSRVDEDCGSGIRESITLLPLESLDLKKGGLGLSDWEREATQLWGVLSSFSPSFSGSESGLPSTTSEPSVNDK